MKELLFACFVSLLLSSTTYAKVQLDKPIQFSGNGNNAKIEGIDEVLNDKDAANKIYVDTAIANRAGGSSAMTFTIGLSKTQDTIVLGITAISRTYQVTVTRTSGDKKPVFLKVSGLPAGISYSLQPGAILPLLLT